MSMQCYLRVSKQIQFKGLDHSAKSGNPRSLRMLESFLIENHSVWSGRGASTDQVSETMIDAIASRDQEAREELELTRSNEFAFLASGWRHSGVLLRVGV